MNQIIDSTDTDAPLFDPNSWKLSNFQAELCDKARKMGSGSFAPRAERWDREASFPVENYEDLKKEGMLGICIPSSEGGIGADFKSYMLAAAEIGRYCGTTALTFNMHVCSCLWTGELADSLGLDQLKLGQLHQGRSLHYQRILDHGAVYSQPFSDITSS